MLDFSNGAFGSIFTSQSCRFLHPRTAVVGRLAYTRCSATDCYISHFMLKRSQTEPQDCDQKCRYTEPKMIRAAGVPALSGGSTRRPLLHRLQQTVHEIRRGRVRALHQASFHTLHYCIPLPESFGMMAMMQWIKESTCSSPAGKHRNASCSCGGCCRC